jgi:serine/threonine protein kinase
MGTVWLASDELLARDVAVKEVRWPPQLGDVERDNLRQRALREAQTAARLDHPNIARVYDVVEEDDRPWIVMQLIPYRSLRDAVLEAGRLPPRRTAQVGLRILAAIQAAHAAGVLHRDVKPGNVLLGPEDHTVLTDFGMAIADGSPTLTTSGLLIGSPSYMAPERARGEFATAAADMWSLGATLYATVEGRPPFDREGALAVLTAVVSMEPDPPSHAGMLWPAISGLLRKDPAQRLDAEQAGRLLAQVADGTDLAPAESTAPLDNDLASRTLQTALPFADAPSLPEPEVPEPEIPEPEVPEPEIPEPEVPEPEIPEPEVPEPQVPEPEKPAAVEEPAKPDEPDDVRPEPQEPPAQDTGPAEPLEPAEPAPADAGSPRLPRLSRSWLLAGAGALAAAAVIATVVLLPGAGPGHSQAAPPARPSPSRGHPTATASPSASTSARSGSTAADGASNVLPAGFTWYHDPTGFSIAMPDGWHVSHQGHLVYIQDPASNRFLIVDQTSQPQSNALDDWRQQEAARISTYPDYHRIRLQAVRYAQAEQAADWEWSYVDSGTLTHVLNRNILVDSRQAYALYWSTPQAQWQASYHYFQAFAATFHPVGVAV